MRKNILSLSIATMIGGMSMIAQANVIVPTGNTAAANLTPAASNVPAGIAAADRLALAPGGVGHMLVTPYFTVQGGNATVISLVNTDPTNAKAVKVRFRGGSNSDDILDFQVYMSPNDVWNGVVTKNATTGVAQFTTSDNTCTLPAFTKGVPQSFITGRLPSYATATELANHTSEGYIEIFNMADIPPNATTTSLYQSILHSAGTPRNCAAATVTATLTDLTVEADAANAGFKAPTTGLFGNWTIINVPQTTTFAGSMTAVRAITGNNGPDGFGNYVLFPQNDTGATGVDSATADPLFRSIAFKTMTNTAVGNSATNAVAIAAANYDLPDMSTPYFGAVDTSAPLTQAGALTSALAVTSVTNEYATDPTVAAATDWTFSMPTRRYSVAMNYGTSVAASSRLYSRVISTIGANNPFFHDSNTSLSGDRICVTAAGQKFYDREEGGKTSGAVFSPGNVSTFRFCGEDSVTSFGSAPVSVLGATLATQTTGSSAFVNGWGVISTPNTTGNAAPNNQVGLPILGSAFIKLSNPQASAGVSGTYGITSDHRFVQAR